MIVLESEKLIPSEENKNGHAVLVIHGWSGSPETMGPLSRLLQRNGFYVYAPLLTGHGCDTKKEFTDAKVEDWVADVHRAYIDLRLRYSEEKVHIVGLSMGALLAMILVNERFCEPASLTLMAPALVASDWTIHLTPFLRFFVKSWKTTPPKIEVSKGKEADDLDNKIYKANTWVSPSYQLLRLQKRVKKLFKGKPSKATYNNDVLVQWALNDEAVALESPQLVQKLLIKEGSKNVDLKMYGVGRHELTLHCPKAVIEASRFIGDRTSVLDLLRSI